jgi:hypothetical protein
VPPTAHSDRTQKGGLERVRPFVCHSAAKPRNLRLLSLVIPQRSGGIRFFSCLSSSSEARKRAGRRTCLFSEARKPSVEGRACCWRDRSRSHPSATPLARHSGGARISVFALLFVIPQRSEGICFFSRLSSSSEARKPSVEGPACSAKRVSPQSKDLPVAGAPPAAHTLPPRPWLVILAQPESQYLPFCLSFRSEAEESAIIASAQNQTAEVQLWPFLSLSAPSGANSPQTSSPSPQKFFLTSAASALPDIRASS